ncbi:hypothetical protein Ddye_014538 [Dipteronia dyeriana]|uniref:Gnk2-homologous domain-containing protein n=1 Tax=Dipteronia dyeriana TaxID=168575 RepID=A0AAD9X8H3_9ROSI|nr:hypothetical protein Ddye_014538 [Dipteronia dyeriana]
MNFTNLLLFFLSYLLLSIGLSTGQICYGTGNFTANSTYGRNRDLILSSLSSVNAIGGFYNDTIGQDSDKVYALALCSGDYSSAEECSNCINDTSHLIMTLCPNQKEAYMWRNCFVRYSNRSFLGVLELNPNQRLYNTGDIKSNLTEFNQIWESLMDGLVRKASRLKFATKETNLTYFQKIYALMQCTPDLSQIDCDVCLRQYVVEYQNCCRGKQGGVVLGPNCVFRWDLYPFYNSTATPDAPPPSPLPPPTTSTITKDHGGGINSRTVVIVVVSISMFLVLVSLAYVFLRKSKAKQDTRSKQGRNCVDEIDFEESLQFNFSTIKAATDDFLDDNKLGQGGFGAVYKTWKNWKGGTALNVIDPTLRVGSTSEILRCIHIGLLCVQENVASRPTMASVVLMLTSSSVSLRIPSKPSFFMHSTMEPSNSVIIGSDQSRRRSVQFSVNEVSITELEPR